MRKLLTGFAVALSVTLVSAATPAQAGPVPPGVTCIGDCGTSPADGVVTLSPLGNAEYLYISTAGGDAGAGQIAGVGGTNGSQMTTASFAAIAGDVLKFYFNYVTSDGSGFADYAFAQLLDSSDSLVATLFTARTQPTGDTSPGFDLPANDSTLTPSTSAIIPGAPDWSLLGGSSGSCFDAGCGYTGWILSEFTITAGGTYSLTFGTTNWGDTAFDTGLAIDGVKINDTPIVPPITAPEPSTLAVLALGLAGLGLVRHRRRR